MLPIHKCLHNLSDYVVSRVVRSQAGFLQHASQWYLADTFSRCAFLEAQHEDVTKVLYLFSRERKIFTFAFATVETRATRRRDGFFHSQSLVNVLRLSLIHI